MTVSAKEVEAAKTANGGWTRETLAKWGVPWPPPAGWRKKLQAEHVRETTRLGGPINGDASSA